MSSQVTKAIFPVAGLGTRFLPATKSIPKEMLTLVDRPLVQYAIAEARAAGIEEFIFVTARGKSALEDYFDCHGGLEQALERAGKRDLLAEVRRTNMASGTIAYVRQAEARGLGHAIWCARRLIGDEPFAVILPDDVIAAETPCLKQMVDVHQRTGGSVVATMRVTADKTSLYGILDAEQADERLLRVKGLVEKPSPETAPSCHAVIGRYILAPEVLRYLDLQRVGAGGEIQLTDAIANEIAEGRSVFGYEFSGCRYDCGSKAGFLQATVAFALARPEFRDELSDFLVERLGVRHAAE